MEEAPALRLAENDRLYTRQSSSDKKPQSTSRKIASGPCKYICMYVCMYVCVRVSLVSIHMLPTSHRTALQCDMDRAAGGLL